MKRYTECLVVTLVIVAGLLLRLTEAARNYLNPDEIQYFFLALPGNFKQLYLSGLSTDHPPLLFFLLHPAALVTRSEIALRLIPVLAGTIFPWVVYRWLASVWTARAGLAALVILTLSPNLISLSAQVRGYTLELLFAALSLLFIETALDDCSIRAMLLFNVSLDLTILSEYSALWFTGAVAIYFVLRSKELKVCPRLLVVWALGQLSAVILYGALYWTSIRPRLAIRHGVVDSYLSGAFPAAHQNLLMFGALSTLNQFAYSFSSVILGIGAAFLFGTALVMLWKSRSPRERTQNRIFATLLVVPFVLACTGALLKVHPYGRSRHTVILCIFMAAGVSIAVEKIFRSCPWISGFAALIVAFVWIFAAKPDQNNIARARDRRTSMIEASNYLRSSIPPGSLVLADEESALNLCFYVSDSHELRLQRDFYSAEGLAVGSFRVIWYRYDFREVDYFLADLASLRSEFGLDRDAPIWVVDSGFYRGIDARLRKRFPGVSLPAYRDFDGAVTVFQAPPGL